MKGMPDNRMLNDQNIVRAIRRAIERFNSASTQDEKMRAVMAAASLGAVALISNRQMSASTISYVEGRLR